MKHDPTRVLLIEDNPGDADLIRLRLVEADSEMDVSFANRLSAGLQSLSENPPSVVLLDLNLPDSHGTETFREVLKKAPGIPVVILSSHDDEEMAAKAVNQGVQDYLVKGGFDSKQLARAMRYAIERQALLTSLEISRRQQLQFKDEFLSHVSHELRTPLTAIYQFVTILLDGLAGALPLEQREHLQTILRSANHLHTMINDLLEATRAESGKLRSEPRCISIAEVINQAVSMMRASAETNKLVIETKVDSTIPLVYADPDRVLQVLTNLLDNAIKFTPADGSISVKACLEPDSEFLHISVADTGRGISPGSRTLIFERLYQDPAAISEIRKGLGLGLYIVQELVRLNGGRIWVESQLGQGSTFSFTLPVFSLAKVIFPIITDQGRLREDLTLLVVEQKASFSSRFGSWKGSRRECVEILQSCIYPDKDILLPPMEGTEDTQTYAIVASTDEEGANILLKRIVGQFERSIVLNSSSTIDLFTMPVVLPVSTDVAILKLVQVVADSVSEMLKNFAVARRYLRKQETFSMALTPDEATP